MDRGKRESLKSLETQRDQEPQGLQAWGVSEEEAARISEGGTRKGSCRASLAGVRSFKIATLPQEIDLSKHFITQKRVRCGWFLAYKRIFSEMKLAVKR